MSPNFLFLRHGCCLPSQRDSDLHRVAQDGRDGTHPKWSGGKEIICGKDDKVLLTCLWPQAEDLVKQKFEFPLPDVEDQDDPLMKGEFMVMLELMQELPGAKEGKEKVKVYMTITFFITKAAFFQWYFSLRKYDISPIKRWTALSICADLGLEGQDFKTLERRSSRPSGSTTLLWRISRFYPPLELWQKKFLHSGHLLLDLSTEKLEGANLKLHGAVSFVSLEWEESYLSGIIFCKPDTSTWSALPPTPKSLDLEALRRALCRSVKNFSGKAGNIYYLQWMDDHAHLRTMIQEGKDGLEWYRCKYLSSFPNQPWCPGRWTRQRCRPWRPWSRHQTIGRRCLTSSKLSLNLLSLHIQVEVIDDWYHFISTFIEW